MKRLIRFLVVGAAAVFAGQLPGETLKQAFRELATIYHAEEAHSMPIHPPVIN